MENKSKPKINVKVIAVICIVVVIAVVILSKCFQLMEAKKMQEAAMRNFTPGSLQGIWECTGSDGARHRFLFYKDSTGGWRVRTDYLAEVIDTPCYADGPGVISVQSDGLQHIELMPSGNHADSREVSIATNSGSERTTISRDQKWWGSSNGNNDANDYISHVEGFTDSFSDHVINQITDLATDRFGTTMYPKFLEFDDSLGSVSAKDFVDDDGYVSGTLTLSPEGNMLTHYEVQFAYDPVSDSVSLTS